MKKSEIDLNKTYYISGPVTKTNDYEKRFDDAEKKLTTLGIRTVNPVALGKSLDQRMGAEEGSLTYGAYMRNDVVALACFCDGIIMLPDWKKSKGATLERNIAESLGMEIFEIDDLLALA